MSLLAIQQDMRAWLVDARRDAPHPAHAAPAAGYRVYRNNYRVALMRCLETGYPMLRDWMGAEAFQQAAIQHVQQHPPHAWTLDAYGADFACTLQQRHPHNPDLHELAWIEWALAESFVAADAPAVAIDALAGMDWDAARLVAAPSLRQRRATTNAAALWQAWLAGETLPESEMLPVAGGVITWRQDVTCRLRALDAIEHAALMMLHDDDRFASLCAALVEHLGEQAGVQRAGELLAGWLQAGIVHCAA